MENVHAILPFQIQITSQVMEAAVPEQPQRVITQCKPPHTPVTWAAIRPRVQVEVKKVVVEPPQM